MSVPIPKTNHMARLREAFAKGRELSATDAAAVAHLHVRRVRQYLKYLHGKREIYIDRWERNHRQGPWFPVYAPAPGMDAPRPRKLSGAENQARYRERRRTPKLDPLTAALLLKR